MLGLTGTFGVSLYTEIVDSGGDSWRRRKRGGEGPFVDNEVLSFGAGGSIVVPLEGGAPCSNHGERVRP
jgi:hypothetical protein